MKEELEKAITAILGIIISVVGIGFFGTFGILAWAFGNIPLTIICTLLFIVSISTFVMIIFYIKNFDN